MRRTELGQLEIVTAVLEPNAAEVAEICGLHDVDPTTAAGGLDVRWQGSMAWDEAGTTQEGATILVLVPDPENAQAGQLLREKGYAETAPVVGKYLVDDQDGLLLMTEYATMNSIERFWFPNENLRLRTSTVIGLSNTASFCVETRLPDGETTTAIEADRAVDVDSLPLHYFSAMGW